MGASKSKARTYVNDCVKAAVDVVNTTVSELKVPVTSIQEISVKNCHGVNFEHIEMGQVAKIDLKQMTTALDDVKTQNAIDEAIKNKATSTAQAAIGYASSDSELVTSVYTELSTSIKNAVRAISESPVQMVQNISCEDSSDINYRYLTFTQMTDLISQQITSHQSVTDSVNSLVQKIDNENASTAKGFDPTAMVAMIAIVVLAFLGFFALGGAGIVGKILTSKIFWLVVCGALSAVGGWALASALSGKFPGTEDDGSEKAKKRNKTVEAVGGGMAGGFGIAALAIVYFGFIRKNTATQ